MKQMSMKQTKWAERRVDLRRRRVRRHHTVARVDTMKRTLDGISHVNDSG